MLLRVRCKSVQEVKVLLTCSQNRWDSSGPPRDPVESASGIVERNELLVLILLLFVTITMAACSLDVLLCAWISMDDFILALFLF